MKICGKECEVYSRIVGYYRPVKRWNKGKQDEFKLRKTFSVKKSTEKKFKWENENGNRTNKRALVNAERS